MNKYSTFLLFTLAAVMISSCNTQSASNENTNQQALAAVAIPSEEAQTEPAIDFGYETTVLDAELASPRKEMVGHIGEANIKINYGSPSVKGRNVWGALVPFGKVWRTGANEATTFTVDQSIQVNGQELAAGTYGLFTLPTEESWQLIFNKTADQWGAYEYDENKDVLRVSVMPDSSEMLSEMVEFVIEGDQLVLLWEKLKVPVQVSFNE